MVHKGRLRDWICIGYVHYLFGVMEGLAYHPVHHEEFEFS
jgi:hypothetical protein